MLEVTMTGEEGEEIMRDICASMLLRALRDAAGPKMPGDARAERQRAMEWILSEDEAPGTFVFCCWMTQRDPARTRKAIVEQRGAGWRCKPAVREMLRAEA